MNRKKLEARIERVLEQEYLHLKTDDGYEVEIYADYRDEMDAATAIEILEADHPRQTFSEKMWEWYMQVEMQEIDSVIDNVKSILESNDKLFPDGMSDYDEETVSEYVKERVYIVLPEKHYLKQEFYVNVCLDTGDGNYDYVHNATRPCWYGQYTDKLHDTASILWLARQQGYTKTQLWNVLSADSRDDVADQGDFLLSMRQEVANCCSQCQQLHFLVRMTFEECIELNALIKLQDRNGKNYDARKNPYCGYIVLDKSTETGLYDCWNGGGSVFEIKLDKDVRIPIRFIAKALPDNERNSYSISSCYGMCRSVWRETLKKIHAPKGVAVYD